MLQSPDVMMGRWRRWTRARTNDTAYVARTEREVSPACSWSRSGVAITSDRGAQVVCMAYRSIQERSAFCSVGRQAC